jgi:hypothetical protein
MKLHHHGDVFTMWRKIGFLLMIFGLVFGQGCGKAVPPQGIVRGRVTFQQKPLTESANVVFSNVETGMEMMAPLASDGSYEVKTNKGNGLPPGNYQVTLTPMPNAPADQPEFFTPSGADTKSQPIKTVIPARYQKAATSKLTATVNVGDNSPFNFDLSP